MGCAYRALNNHEWSIKSYCKAIEFRPNDTSTYVTLGEIYLSLQKWQDAIDSFKKAIILGTPTAEINFGLGVAYGYTKNFAKAIESFSEAVKLKPQESRYFFARAQAYSAMNNSEAAIADCQKALHLANNNYPQAHQLLLQLRPVAISGPIQQKSAGMQTSQRPSSYQAPLRPCFSYFSLKA